MSSHRCFRLVPRARRRVRRRRLPARLIAGLSTALALLAAANGASSAQGDEPVAYEPPVDAPVVDAFRPPTRPFGPGNRGLEYATEPGTPVRASGAGEVVFAGQVGGARHVTVRHADGIRTSYSYLDRIDVVLGEHVDGGQQVGTTGDRLHFGARQGDAYFDPATLFDRATRVEVELVPFEVPPRMTPHQERAALQLLALDGGGGLGFDLPSLGDVASWVTRRAPLIRHYADDLDPIGRGFAVGESIISRLTSTAPCSDQPPPAQPVRHDDRVAILVGGLGSSSGSASIDRLRTDELGYGADDTVRFSYAGGPTVETAQVLPDVEPSRYGSAETQVDLQQSARHLADLVEDALAVRPDDTVDLYAHSMGGVVSRLALDELDGRGVDLGRIGLVTTFGSPHQGADLATMLAAADTTLPGDLALDAAAQLLDSGLNPRSEAVAQLAETSAVVASMQERGTPDGVEVVSLAASGDYVVPAPNTVVPGARNVTVTLSGESAHSDLVASDEATAEVARALAGEPPGCEDPWEVATEQLTGQAISFTEDLAGAAVLYASD